MERMNAQRPVGEAAAEVASCTAAAAHRRDHHHQARSQCCQPHCVEVIHLGQRAVAICHDCQRDSGFLPHRDAERLADEHRRAPGRSACRCRVLPRPEGAGWTTRADRLTATDGGHGRAEPLVSLTPEGHYGVTATGSGRSDRHGLRTLLGRHRLLLETLCPRTGRLPVFRASTRTWRHWAARHPRRFRPRPARPARCRPRSSRGRRPREGMKRPASQRHPPSHREGEHVHPGVPGPRLATATT